MILSARQVFPNHNDDPRPQEALIPVVAWSAAGDGKSPPARSAPSPRNTRSMVEARAHGHCAMPDDRGDTPSTPTILAEIVPARASSQNFHASNPDPSAARVIATEHRAAGRKE